MLPVIKAASPQTADVYKLLAGGRPLTAQEIAEALGILPNAVYRVVKKLMDMAMVEELGGYPARFQAVSAQTALNMYLVAAGQNFRREFGLLGQALPHAGDSPTLSLFKDRPGMLRRELVDLRCARESMDLIVSGHEVPDENVRATRAAIQRGVVVRKIIHQPEQLRTPFNQMMRGIGVQIRLLTELDIRLIVFDKRVVYLTSYDAAKPASAFGVRFEYVPLGLQMSEVFEQNWARAEVFHKSY